jgi:hypothetical protein
LLTGLRTQQTSNSEPELAPLPPPCTTLAAGYDLHQHPPSTPQMWQQQVPAPACGLSGPPSPCAHISQPLRVRLINLMAHRHATGKEKNMSSKTLRGAATRTAEILDIMARTAAS